MTFLNQNLNKFIPNWLVDELESTHTDRSKHSLLESQLKSKEEGKKSKIKFNKDAKPFTPKTPKLQKLNFTNKNCKNQPIFERFSNNGMENDFNCNSIAPNLNTTNFKVYEVTQIDEIFNENKEKCDNEGKVFQKKNYNSVYDGFYYFKGNGFQNNNNIANNSNMSNISNLNTFNNNGSLNNTINSGYFTHFNNSNIIVPNNNNRIFEFNSNIKGSNNFVPNNNNNFLPNNNNFVPSNLSTLNITPNAIIFTDEGKELDLTQYLKTNKGSKDFKRRLLTTNEREISKIIFLLKDNMYDLLTNYNSSLFFQELIKLCNAYQKIELIANVFLFFNQFRFRKQKN